MEKVMCRRELKSPLESNRTTPNKTIKIPMLLLIVMASLKNIREIISIKIGKVMDIKDKLNAEVVWLAI